MRKLKYISIFLLPITVLIAFNCFGWLSFLPVFVFFGMVPFLELFLKPDKFNFTESQLKAAKHDPFYDRLLYLIVPVQIAFLIYFFFIIKDTTLWSVEFFGRAYSMGLMCGVFGINIGHELGHRTNRKEKLLGEIALLTSLETHFLPFHNSGHHYNVATPEDPATARRGEWVYTFWFRSQVGSYFQAWQMEINRMKKIGQRWWALSNKMIGYTLAQLALLVLILLVFGVEVLLAFLFAATIGILLLETVNYIEHYGLLRRKKENGRYERVLPKHSWNSDHVIGRVLLFELSRHSDHHYKASKHYQILETIPDSPQMPTGYPGMMILALVPPVWIWFMNKQLAKQEKTTNSLHYAA